MRQVGSIPDRKAVRRALGERPRQIGSRLVGARKRNRKIEAGAGLQHVADAPQNAIHLPKSTKSVAINDLQALRLLEQFFFPHFEFPRPHAKAREHTTTNVGFPTLQRCEIDHFRSHADVCSKSIHAGRAGYERRGA